jgi:hypothetical protein
MGREADNSLTSSDEVKNGGTIPPLCHTSKWRGAYFIKRGDNCSFVFFFLVSAGC